MHGAGVPVGVFVGVGFAAGGTKVSAGVAAAAAGPACGWRLLPGERVSRWRAWRQGCVNDCQSHKQGHNQ